MMAKRKLELGTVGELRDGLVGKVFDRALSAALADCEDRPGNKTPRVISLKLLVSPEGDKGDCDRVQFATSITLSKPPELIKAHEGRLMRRRVGNDSVLEAVIGGDADNVDQGTLHGG